MRVRRAPGTGVGDPSAAAACDSAAIALGILQILGGLIAGVVVLTGLAVGARRLLGVEVGALRTAFAGAIGYLAAALVSSAADGDDAWALLPVLVGVAVLVAMAVLAVAEALLPSGPRRRPVRDLGRRVGRSRRYWQICAIAARHGVWRLLTGRERFGSRSPESRRRLAQQLREALEDGGVTFVKLGQLLSTRRDLLPPEVADELGRLQDEVPPEPWEGVATVLAEELGESALAHVDPVPLGSASIAQVHAARLHDGTDVVVKVRRAAIEREVARDLDIIARLARMAGARAARGAHAMGTIEPRAARGFDLDALVDGFTAALREELDLRVEARNLQAVAAVAAPERLHVPAVHEALCTRRVLVMQRLDGTPVGRAGAELSRNGSDRTALARALLDELLTQITRDGVFHADPHPGNVMLLEGGGLALLDFGSVGRLDASLRSALRDLLVAVERGDSEALRDALLDISLRPDELDEAAFDRAVARFAGRHLAAGAPSPAMYSELVELVAGFGLGVPGDVAGAFRALTALEGTLALLSPGFDLVEESRRFAKQQLTMALRPDALRDTAATELLGLLPVLRRLPHRVDRIATTVGDGRLTVNVRLLADRRDRRIVTTLVHQALLTFLAAALGLMGVLLLGTAGGPEVSDTTSLFDVLGYSLLLVGMILVLRMLIVMFRPER